MHTKRYTIKKEGPKIQIASFRLTIDFVLSHSHMQITFNHFLISAEATVNEHIAKYIVKYFALFSFTVENKLI